MIEIIRQKLGKDVEEKIEIFLDNLVSMSIDDVVQIVAEVYGAWVKNISIDDVKEFSRTHSPISEAPYHYDRYALSGITRYFMISYMMHYLMEAPIDPSQGREAITGWRDIKPRELEETVLQILDWLKVLETNVAFDAIAELIFLWTERYNSQMGLEYGQRYGWTTFGFDESGYTMFLRWCVYSDFEYADMGINIEQWKDNPYEL
jgi:hypothetical protein